MNTEKKLFNRQDLKSFAAGVITRARNGPRAVFAVQEDQEIIYRDIPDNGQNFGKLMKCQPETLVGIYDTRVKPNDLFNDLRLV